MVFRALGFLAVAVLSLGVEAQEYSYLGVSPADQQECKVRFKVDNEGKIRAFAIFGQEVEKGGVVAYTGRRVSWYPSSYLERRSGEANAIDVPAGYVAAENPSRNGESVSLQVKIEPQQNLLERLFGVIRGDFSKIATFDLDFHVGGVPGEVSLKSVELNWSVLLGNKVTASHVAVPCSNLKLVKLGDIRN